LEEQVRKLQDMLQSVLDKQSQPSRHVQFDVPRVPRAVKSVTCYNCLQEGHLSFNCRAPCGYCEKLGHISRDCPTHVQHGVPRSVKPLN
jgi:hypothetical protein